MTPTSRPIILSHSSVILSHSPVILSRSEESILPQAYKGGQA